LKLKKKLRTNNLTATPEFEGTRIPAQMVFYEI